MATVVRWNPWRELARLDREMAEHADRNGGARAYRLAVDAFETEDAIVIVASVPGLAPEDIQVNLEDDVLHIEGTINNSIAEDAKVLIRERAGEGRFYRNLRLNVPVDIENIEATFVNGILTLNVPKAPEAKPHMIPVKKIAN